MGDWAEAKAADGRLYYWNKATKATSWEKPKDFESAAPHIPTGPANPDDWAEANAPDGRKYWFNKVTRETTWTQPPVLANRQNGRADFVAGGGGSGRDHGRQGHEDRLMRRDDRGHGLPQKPSFDSSRGGGGGSMPWDARQENIGYRGALAKTDKPEYATREEAEAAFFKLLRQHGVKSDMEWRDALKLVVRDREYRAIEEPRDRKVAFEKYCREAREQEREKEKERRERMREDFRNMLATHDDIKHYTRWKTAEPLIKKEAAFKSGGSDAEKRKMFDEYIMELKRKHVEDEIARYRQAMVQLNEMVKALIIDPETRWADAEDKIMNSERFHSDDIFKAVHKLDVFTAYENHLKALERSANNTLQREKQLRKRSHRKAREMYKRLLREHHRAGKIKADTKWQDFLPLIKDHEHYLDYLGVPGSEPIELFWDLVQIEERTLRGKSNEATDVLYAERFELTLETPFDEFAELMHHHPKTARFNDHELRMIFNRLIEKVKRRAEEDKIAAERNRSRTVDLLRHAMKRLEPPVRPDDSYEDVAKRLSGHRDFEAASEDVRNIAYDKYMRRLKDRDLDDRDRRRDRDRDRDARNGSRRDDYDRDDRPRRHRTRTRSPEYDAYEADRRKAQEARERSYRKPSFGLTPPPRDRRDDRYDRRNSRHEVSVSIYDRERREREMERERSYISRADPRDKGRTLDYGDDDAVGSRPGSIRKRQSSEASLDSRRESKRSRRGDRRTRTPEPLGPECLLKEEPPALQSGSEEGEIEEI